MSAPKQTDSLARLDVPYLYSRAQSLPVCLICRRIRCSAAGRVGNLVMLVHSLELDEMRWSPTLYI
eukprot:scaffold1499_cov170-Amphora_coffeaeformis.AAC.15